MINSVDLIGKFQYALDNKWGYIWGAAGTKWTEAKQKAATREMTVKYGSKWIGHTVADCSGLFKWAFKQLGSDIYHGSDTMFRKWCSASGELSKGARTDGQELKPGTAVFTWKPADKKYGHVGLYIGNGSVIEAKGTQYGVVKSKVTETRWTHWGELKDVLLDGQPAPEPTPDPKPEKRPTLRRGSKGPYVIEVQTALVKLGYGIGPCGIDGDYGRATLAAVEKFQYDRKITPIDGICGPKTWAGIDEALKILDAKPVITYTVVIRGLSLDEADSLVMKYKNAEASAEGSGK